MDISKTLIVMPGYNVGAIIDKTIKELPPNCASEIILVDDGSSDDTAEAGRRLGLTVVQHSQNKGYGAAQKTGYKEAMKREVEAVVLVHGDNQYDPALVGAFAEKIIDQGYDMVTGTRMVLGDAIQRGMPIWKYIPNRCLTWLENFVFRTNISDYHNGYRAYSTAFLKRIPLDLLSDKFDFDTDIIIQAAMRKCRIAEIPHTTRYMDENSQMPFSKGVVYGLSILKTVFKYLMHKARLYRQKVYEV